MKRRMADLLLFVILRCCVDWECWLDRGQAKFAGVFRVVRSPKWGFTKWNREEYLKMKAEGLFVKDGVNVKHVNGRGPLAKTATYVIRG
jgi:hypothetical protein